MAVTNPDKVVTKQDLADFYEEIFPYLGGMPEMVANKFSKSDIYSTTEKMIGQWTDGKPIYQKTFTGTLTNTSAVGTETNTNVSVGANVDNFVEIYGYCKVAANGVYQPIVFAKGASPYLRYTGNINSASPANTIVLTNAWITAGTVTYYVTAKYTKTTDSAISIGVDTDYSTTEKIIGTWIDGKPLYQKTIPITLPTCTTDGTEVSTSFAIGASIDVVVDAKVLYLQDGKWTALFANNGSTSKFIRFLVQTNAFSTVADRNKIRIGNAAKSASGCTGYATIQYTKTT